MSVEVLQVALCVVIASAFALGLFFDWCDSERSSIDFVDRRSNVNDSGASAAEG